MQEELINLKRLSICSTLYKQDWDYKDLSFKEKFFQKCFYEIVGWFGRRGNKLSPSVLSSTIEKLGIKNNIDPITIAEIESSIRNAMDEYVYKAIDSPVPNSDGIIKTGKQTHLHYKIPCIAKNEDRVYAFISNPLYNTEFKLTQSFEAKFIALWSFYYLNRYPSVHNIFYSESKNGYDLVRTRVKKDQIKIYKNTLVNASKILHNEFYSATAEICNGCDRSIECQNLKLKQS